MIKAKRFGPDGHETGCCVCGISREMPRPLSCAGVGVGVGATITCANANKQKSVTEMINGGYIFIFIAPLDHFAIGFRAANFTQRAQSFPLCALCILRVLCVTTGHAPKINSSELLKPRLRSYLQARSESRATARRGSRPSSKSHALRLRASDRQARAPSAD